MKHQLSEVKRAVLTAASIALCVVLPLAFHAIPNAGNIFLPMHIPVLLCGLLCGWQYGLFCGVTGPLLSSVLTAMPPAAVLPGMVTELAVFGVVTGFMMKIIHTKRLFADLYISLITAVLLGKVISGVAKAFIFAAGEYSMTAWVSASFVTAWPGLLLQLALVPAVVAALEKAKLIPTRYPNGGSNEL